MKTTNPFPGMNPFLQARWPDVHTRLIAYISDAINDQLPADLSVHAEEGIMIDFAEEPPSGVRADVAVVENRSLRQPEYEQAATATLEVAEPVRVRIPLTRRWLEIRDRNERLVTVIEVISPVNKSDSRWLRFVERQVKLLLAGVNLLEIDLIRGGNATIPPEFEDVIEKCESTRFLIMAARANDPEEREIYYCPLKQRLPVIGVPLRPTDKDLPLDLQPLIDRCYQTGRYWNDSQGAIPGPPLTPEEQAWANQLLTEAGLIG